MDYLITKILTNKELFTNAGNLGISLFYDISLTCSITVRQNHLLSTANMVSANNISKKWLAQCQHHYSVIILTIKKCRCSRVHTAWNTKELRMIKVHLIGFWRNLISGESGGEGGVGLAPFLISSLYFKQCWLTSVGHGASGKNWISGTKWITFIKMVFYKMGSFPK